MQSRHSLRRIIQRCLPIVLLGCAAALQAGGHIRGGCTVGQSELAHGFSDDRAIQQMRDYARMYATRFKQFRETERDTRSSINELLELEQWTQQDIVAFTELQRKLLYLSVGSQLATGRVIVDELPAYARTIRQKITDIEIELGCDSLPDAS